MPHYDELSAAMTNAIKWLFVPARTLIGVEGNTALVCQNSTYRVVGSGGVTIWNHRGKRRYGDGEIVEGWR